MCTKGCGAVWGSNDVGSDEYLEKEEKRSRWLYIMIREREDRNICTSVMHGWRL